MTEMTISRSTEPRIILENVIDKKMPAIMSYLSRGRWYGIKVLFSRIGATQLEAESIFDKPDSHAAKKPEHKLHTRRFLRITTGQKVGISIKYGYGKFIFDSSVISVKSASEAEKCDRIALSIPKKMEIVPRRNYFRVNVPASLNVCSTIWHRRPRADGRSVRPEQNWNGQLADISAGGMEIVIDAADNPPFARGSFIEASFVPMPYEEPVLLAGHVRNVALTADSKNVCLGIQFVGLEGCDDGLNALKRLCCVVEHYHLLNQAANQQAEAEMAFSV